MKKRLSAVLTLMICILTACGGTSAASFSTTSGVSSDNSSIDNNQISTSADSQASMENAKKALYALEKNQNDIFYAESWALDYVDAFLQSCDWEDLAIARIACVTAANSISGMVKIERLSDSECLELANAGVEADAFNMEIDACNDFIDSEVGFLKNTIMEDLMIGCFTTSGLDNDIKRIDLKYDYISEYSKYMGLFANNMLLEMNTSDVSELWNQYQSDCAYMSQYWLEWADQEEDIESAGVELSSNIQNFNTEYEKINALGDEEIIHAKEDEDYFKKNMVKLYNTPSFLPQPLWYITENMSYEAQYVEDGTYKEYHIGDDLSSNTSTSLFSDIFSDVTLEDVQAYVDEMVAEGYLDLDNYDSDNKTWDLSKDSQILRIECLDTSGSAKFTFQNTSSTLMTYWYLEE